MSGHAGCVRLKMTSSWSNHNGHNVQIWLTAGHSSFFFPLQNVLIVRDGEARPLAAARGMGTADIQTQTEGGPVATLMFL